MVVNETIVAGRKFRKCIDAANKLWQRISFWTKSSDVEFDDGKDAETKLGVINGITSDLNCEDETIAASAVALRALNANFDTFKTNFNNAANAVRNAISGKGISVPANATLSQMASLISSSLYVPPTSQNGTQSVTMALNYGEKQFMVNFSKPFAKAPKVIISTNGQFTTPGSVISTTTTGFTYKLTAPNASSSQYVGLSYNVTVSWNATSA